MQSEELNSFLTKVFVFQFSLEQNCSELFIFLIKSVQNNNLLKPNDIYIYMSYRSANLQTQHFKYLFNKYTY